MSLFLSADRGALPTVPRISPKLNPRFIDVDDDDTDGYSSDDSLYLHHIFRKSGRSIPDLSSWRMKISYICSTPAKIAEAQKETLAGREVKEFLQSTTQAESTMTMSPGSVSSRTVVRPSIQKDNAILCLLTKSKIKRSALTRHELLSRQSNSLKKRRKPREYPYRVRFVEESVCPPSHKHHIRQLHPMKEVHDVMMVLDWRSLLKEKARGVENSSVEGDKDGSYTSSGSSSEASHELDRPLTGQCHLNAEDSILEMA
ncbi:hypothetical protein CVT26_003676 [Gymnopilus dilepis]|uniref:Uncharacterized protein n=1 Tax=Gymnopilus dilepis TaxID=231916 RepID=A0A409X1V7_9AGAR|nr:hypothetical protein CVT26_003676 [Gymnopilus dilepis]